MTVDKIQEELNNTFKRLFTTTKEFDNLVKLIRSTEIHNIEYVMGIWFYKVRSKQYSIDDFDDIQHTLDKFGYEHEFAKYLEDEVMTVSLFDEYSFVIEDLINDAI